MPIVVIHPSAFPERYGLRRAPSKTALHEWRKKRGFPTPLTIPEGHFVRDEVDAWFEARVNDRGQKAA